MTDMMNKKSKLKYLEQKNSIFNIQIFNGEGVGRKRKHTETDNKMQERTVSAIHVEHSLSHTSLQSTSRRHLQNKTVACMHHILTVQVDQWLCIFSCVVSIFLVIRS